ncbi:MAG: hypothetical protein IJY11_01845 [Clostridia bacterium]|nr:hypothetical protein [Clostridia bacterium]
MKVKDLVVAAAELLGDVTAESVRKYTEEADVEGEAVVNELLRCFNLVETELAVDYLPLKTQEEVETDTGAVPYLTLSKRAVQIVKVTDEWGLAIRFQLFGDYFKAQVGRLKVTYTYAPEPKGLEGETDFQSLVSYRLFAYGMAAEYCLKAGLYEEAEVWDKKYKSAITAAYKKTPCRLVRRRVWR